MSEVPRIGAGSALLVGAALLWAVGHAHAEGLGRLFSTPEERARLDEIRADPDFGKPPPVEEVLGEPSPSEPARPSVPEVTINGVVMRGHGPDTAWINGHEVAVGEISPEGVRVERQGRGTGVRIELPDGTRTVAIKPGQRIDVLTSTVLEPYQYRGAAQAGPAFEEGPADGPPEPGGAAREPPAAGAAGVGGGG